ncbi:MAG: hypothetical protein U1F11_02225 [Steroidobacteraceae bacterium]
MSGYYNFPNSPQPGVLFPSAMADAIANLDLAEQSPQSAGSADIRATFNSSVDSDPVCLGGRRFYYGLDHQLDRDGNGTRDFASDLLRVVLHELGHGLGFISIVDLATGNGVNDSGGTEHFAIYDQFIYDETVALSWPQMNAAQRLQSSHNNGNLAWSGTRVNAHLNRLSAGISTGRRLRLYAPSTPGSTGGPVSHWDTVATPSLLMELFETAVGGSTTDFTTCALGDMGWTLTARACPDLPNKRAGRRRPGGQRDRGHRQGDHARRQRCRRRRTALRDRRAADARHAQRHRAEPDLHAERECQRHGQLHVHDQRRPGHLDARHGHHQHRRGQ